MCTNTCWKESWIAVEIQSCRSWRDRHQRIELRSKNDILRKNQYSTRFSFIFVVDRTGIDPAAVDDVVFGCVSQIGAQAGNIARFCVLASKLPESVPATTVDRQCGSSLQAVHFAAQGVMSGTQDCVIAGGVEVMSLVKERKICVSLHSHLYSVVVVIRFQLVHH